MEYILEQNIIKKALKYTFSFFLFFYIIYFLNSLSHAPNMLDDFTTAYLQFNMSDPGIARGPIWILLCRMFLRGLSTPVSHIVIGIIHVGNVLLFGYLVLRIWKGTISPIITASMVVAMISNPIISDNLLWIVAGYPVFVMFFSLIAVFFLLEYFSKKKNRDLFLFILFSALSYLTNEQGLIIFPFYIIILMVANSEIFSFRQLKVTLIKVSKVLVIWVSPYLAYRVFIYIIYGSKSAVPTYKQIYNPKIMFISYCKMIYKLMESINLENILAVVLLLLILIPVLGIIQHKKLSIRNIYGAINANLIIVALLAVFIVWMLLPFSLLGGWFEYRFLYIGSNLLVMLSFVVMGLLSRDLLKTLDDKVLIKKIAVSLLIAVYATMSLFAVKSYDQLTLKPIVNMNFFVNNLITKQKQEYVKLPKGSTVLLFIHNPNYLSPEYLFGGNPSAALAASWVPIGMSQWGLIPNDVHVYFLNGVTSQSGHITTPLALWLIDLKSYDSITDTNKPIYCYTYDGQSLTRNRGSYLSVIDQDKEIKKILLQQ